MRNRISGIIAFVLWLWTFEASAQAPNWQVSAQNYQYQMVTVGALNLNGIESTDTNDLLGAFINGELRGVGRPVYIASANRYLVYMNIYHHDGSGEVSFKIYDASENKTVDLEQKEAFEIQAVRGTTTAPVVYSHPRLSSEANFLTFTLPGQETSVINGSNITVTMPYGYDVRNIAPVYTTSALAKVLVNNLVQSSGFSSHNFTNPVYYRVIAADATSEKNYTVTVKFASAPLEGVVLSRTQLSESSAPGTTVGTLRAIDPDGEGTFTYHLVNGTGDKDNSFFEITNDQLVLRKKMDYETQITHSLRVKAIDENNNSIETVLQVTALNENDEKPLPVSATVPIPENQPTSTLVHTMQVTDPDGPSNFTYSIYDGNIDGKFSIHAQKGEIRVAKLMDFELEKRIYELDILVSDGINENHASLTFQILNVNDNAPTVTVETLSVQENAAVGTIIHTLSPTDPDGPSTFTYRLLDSQTPLQVEPNGAITVAGAIDFEKNQSYTLKVGISDGVNEGSFQFPVQVVNRNDEAPVVIGKALTLSEKAAVGTLVTTVEATDPDGPTTFAFRITEGNADGKFAIDATTGKLTLQNVVDYEKVTSYALKIAVSDGVQETSANFPVQIINENDEKPLPVSTTVTIPENQPNGTLVHTLAVTDPDGLSTFSFRILAGNGEGKFSLHEQKGEIRILRLIDYETDNRVYELDITVSDGINENQATITFNLLNLNDVAPTVAIETLRISETAATGTVFHTLTPSDADGASTFTYRVINTLPVPFAVNAAGAISVTGVLDYEKVKTYSLQIGISDGVNEGTFTFPVEVVNENDEAPVVAGKSVTLSEKAAIGALVTTVEATDPDGPTTFSYRITSGNADNKFSLEANTGRITLQNLVDYEKVTAYQLQVAVNDGLRETLANVAIQVLNENDEKPVPVSASVDIPENQPTGTLVHTLAVTDPDGTSAFTFKILAGNDDAKFTINEQRGELRIARLIDFETDKKQFNLEVQVSDGVNTNEAIITFKIQNINDVAPTVAVETISVSETAALATSIHQLHPEDVDGASTFTYRILNTQVTPFAVDATGSITVATPLDYEKVKTYSLRIGISDGVNEGQFTFPVEVRNENDEKPVAISRNLTVSENSPIGHLVHKVEATDPDGATAFTYTITGGNADNRFALEAQTGELKLQSLLDYEKVTAYTLTVAVSDGVQQTTATYQVQVLNENDEKPLPLSKSITIPENQPTGTLVHTMEVTDPDGSTSYSYRIYDGNLEGKFTIHQQKGELRILQPIDYEFDKRSYELEILVSDGINESFATISIQIENLNDNKPFVAEKALTVQETSPIGTLLHRLEPTDQDDATTFTYRVLNPATTPFAVDADGIVTVAAALDYEKIKKYDLKIELSDGLNKVTYTFPIQVINENDEKPELSFTTADVMNTAAPGTQFAQLQATDPDNDGSTITYSLITTNTPFALTPDGKFTITQALALTDQNRYVLQVGITDQVNTHVQEFTVNVIDEGEFDMEIANVLTPNNDGYNDFWEIKRGYLYPNYIFRVFDTRGQEVFFSKGYRENFWDGTFQGKKLPTGTYIYTVQSENKRKVYKGTLNILH
ncbi:cadherin domain-containing protein [Rufibacter ruber]|uniref:cadherin domain-containing protein n=1 Tax=Rufibacter ruber TaxID=1783499 RepID=UPI0009ED1717|nr:cadherin domain-containing protein [Rufibacter ruber]